MRVPANDVVDGPAENFTGKVRVQSSTSAMSHFALAESQRIGVDMVRARTRRGLLAGHKSAT